MNRKIDFRALRHRVSIRQVLELLDWSYLTRSGDEMRGQCPIHGSRNPRSRTFSVHLGKNVFQCWNPGCRAKGNQLDLYAQVTRQTLYRGCIDLCGRMGIHVPFIGVQNCDGF